MPVVLRISRLRRAAWLTAFLAGQCALSVPAAEPLSSTQQTVLVQKYCAVCHTDAARNGGLSLQHYDAGQPNPPLAAMLLSKMRTGALGAAGLREPEPAIRDAWFAATAAQAEGAKRWSVIRTETPGSKDSVLVASIVRDVLPRAQGADGPLYRLTLSCNPASGQGEMQLTWSPAPQTDRTFSVAADGSAGIPHQLQGKEEKMGNGTNASTGLASAVLQTRMPEKTLAIADLFPGETVVFPMGELNQVDRREFAACFAARASR